MATKKEIDHHLSIALSEVGKIGPWYDEEVDCWVFSHKAYPVEYGGKSKTEVIRNYPKYLREFIRQRLNDNLAPSIEIKTKGRGGRRDGAGRTKGSKKETKKRVYLPLDVADWVQDPGAISQIRAMMAKSHH